MLVAFALQAAHVSSKASTTSPFSLIFVQSSLVNLHFYLEFTIW